MTPPYAPAASQSPSGIGSPESGPAPATAQAPQRPRVVGVPVVRGVRVFLLGELTPAQRRSTAAHFDEVFPALTPLAVGPGHPFPHVRGDTLHVAVSLAGRGDRASGRPPHLAIVPIPPGLPRLVGVPSEAGEAYALLEEIVAAGAGALFPGREVAECVPFRIRCGRPLDGSRPRLELPSRASPELEVSLTAALRLASGAVQRVAEPL